MHFNFIMQFYLFQSCRTACAHSRMLSIFTYGIAIDPAAFAFLAFRSLNSYFQVFTSGRFYAAGQTFHQFSLRYDQQCRQITFNGSEYRQRFACSMQLDFSVQRMTDSFSAAGTFQNSGDLAADLDEVIPFAF